MKKLQLMERNIDRENATRLESVQRSIESRKIKDELNIHKKIDALNKGSKTELLHLQRQVTNSKKKATNENRLYVR